LFRKPQQICYGVNAETTATFQQVKECLDEITGLSNSEVEFYQINEYGFACSYGITEEIHVLGPVNCVYAMELPTLPAGTPYGEELILIVCNIVQFSDRSKPFRRFGGPFVVNVQRDIPYDELLMLILKETHLSLKSNVHLQVKRMATDYKTAFFAYAVLIGFSPQIVLLKMLDLFILDECNESRYIPPDVALPFYVEVVDRFVVCDEDPVAEHQSAVVMKQGIGTSSTQTLIDCITRYTKPEILPWYCPGCREYKEEAEKRILFCWLPDVLIFHLQRFKQADSTHLIKLDARVEFPLTDLNLNQFTNQNSDYKDAYKQAGRISSFGKSGFGKLYSNSRENNNVYDLFATCNHHGDSPDAGHYTGILTVNFGSLHDLHGS
uniref:ubiquitinyl hydrolase 1 n=1 Tax=Soboliphyme baturini TaxID=241478 RepID=A0A183I8Y3_9BILA